MMNFIFRVILLLLGLVFAASLAVVVMLLAAVWGVRYAWGRLTGKPVTPWVMRFNPRSGFDRFRHAAQPAEPTAADMANARARGESVRSPIAIGPADDVTDVRARPARGE
jgi:flagellar biosynthesis protein FlhB